jgi:hypothetical protein
VNSSARVPSLDTAIEPTLAGARSTRSTPDGSRLYAVVPVSPTTRTPACPAWRTAA